MLFIHNTETDPFYNLAAEEFLVKEFSEEIFMLWQNHNTIVIGRNQNTLAEINYDYVKENDISVVRRMSGGGAVFHDMGNINFTFIVNAGDDDFSNYAKFTGPVIDFLQSLGAKAELRGRNDLVIDDKKISGNAQYMHKDRMLHHGTLLYSSEESKLGEALRVSDDKVKSKGIKSVRSRITNISNYLENPMSPAEFIRAFADFMVTNNPDCKYYDLNQHRAEITKLRDEKYATWDWNFGYSPAYSFSKKERYPFGGVEVQMDIDKNSVISDVKIFGDFFSKEPVSTLEDALRGVLHEQETITAALKKVNVSDCISGITEEEFINLLF